MTDLFTLRDTAGAIFILAIVIASGLCLGKLKVKGISLGSTWILFMGIFSLVVFIHRVFFRQNSQD